MACQKQIGRSFITQTKHIVLGFASFFLLLSPFDANCLSFRGKTFGETSVSEVLNEPIVSSGGNAFLQQKVLPQHSLTVGKIRRGKVKFTQLSDTHPSITNGFILGIGDNGAVVGTYLSSDQDTCEVRQYANEDVFSLHTYPSLKGPSPAQPVCSHLQGSYAISSKGEYLLASAASASSEGEDYTEVTVVAYTPSGSRTVATASFPGSNSDIREMLIDRKGRILVRIGDRLIQISPKGKVSIIEIPVSISGIGGPELFSGIQVLFSYESSVHILNTRRSSVRTIQNFTDLPELDGQPSPIHLQSNGFVIVSEGIISRNKNKLFRSGNLARKFSDIKGFGVLRNGQVLAHFYVNGESGTGATADLGLITIRTSGK